MDLTAEQLLDIVRDLKGDPAQRRRLLPRVGLRSTLRLWPCDAKRHTSKEPVVLRLRDISRRGMGAISPASLDVGNPVLLEVPYEMQEGTMWVLGRVVRSTAQRAAHGDRNADKGHLVGIELMLDTPRALLDVYVQRVQSRAAWLQSRGRAACVCARRPSGSR